MSDVVSSANRDALADEEQQWHRVHFLSPVAKSWKTLLVLLAIIGIRGIDSIETIRDIMQGKSYLSGHILMTIVAIAVILLLVIIYNTLAWVRTSYSVTVTDVHFREGIFSRTHRRVALDRIQATDVQFSLLGRFVGLGTLTIESAGGAESHVAIGLLRINELQELRERVDHLAAYAQHRTPQKPKASESDSAQPDRDADEGAQRSRGYEYVRVPLDRFLLSFLYSINTIASLAVLVAVIIATVIFIATRGFEYIFANLLTLFIAVSYGFSGYRSFVTQYGYVLSLTSSGLHITHGLTSTVSQTISPARIHGIVLTQPWLWRKKDWWKVEIIAAGYATEESESQKNAHATTVILPVATREEAYGVLWIVLPRLGANNPRDFLSCALDGNGKDGHFITTLPAARMFHPLQWRRHGGALTDTLAVVRSGRFHHRTLFVAYEHVQSAAVKQGPIARAQHTAEAILHLADSQHSSVSIYAVDPDHACMIRDTVLARSRQRPNDETRQEWLDRVLVPLQDRHANLSAHDRTRYSVEEPGLHSED